MNIESKGSNISSIQEVAKKSVDERVKIMQKTVDPAVLKAFQNDPSDKVKMAVYSNEFTPAKVAWHIFAILYYKTPNGKGKASLILALSKPLTYIDCSKNSNYNTILEHILDNFNDASKKSNKKLAEFISIHKSIYTALSKNPKGSRFLRTLFSKIKNSGRRFSALRSYPRIKERGYKEVRPSLATIAKAFITSNNKEKEFDQYPVKLNMGKMIKSEKDRKLWSKKIRDFYKFVRKCKKNSDKLRDKK